MAGLTEFVGELSRERWRAKEADSEFVIAETNEVRPASRGDALAESVAAESIVVIGNAPRGEFIPGLTYRFLGRWDEDRKDKYTGRVERQFRFNQYVKAEPHSRYGLVSYLAKYAPGIGPVIAGRLFDEFGSEAVKVLREFPEKCVTVANFKGRTLLTIEKATEAAAKLQSMGKLEDTKIELTGIFTDRGFPHTLVEQCIRVWGVLAPKRIARDPFSMLVRKLSGCGFARCKRLYDDLGLPPGRLKVQMLCLWHGLRTDNNGHTWFPAGQCKQSLEQAVSGVRVNFVRAVKLGLRSRWLARRNDAGGNLWLAEFTKADNEKTVAERLAMLLCEAEPLPTFQTDIEEATAERLSQIEDHQQKESSNESGSHGHEDGRIENHTDGCGSEDAQVDASKSDQRQREHDTKYGSIDPVQRDRLRERSWQLSSKRLTVFVATNSSNVITDAAPVVRKFVGQPIANLELWLSRQGGFERRRLNVGEQAESHNERLARIGRERGVCQFCQKELTNPISLQYGYGPCCAKRMGLPYEITSETHEFVSVE